MAAVREGLDDPERYFGTIDDIVAQRQKAAEPLYKKAYETPVPFTQKLEGLLGRGNNASSQVRCRAETNIDIQLIDTRI